MDIKFRAWDIENKSMWSWEEIEKFWESEGYCSTILGGDHWVPMQFTGEHDINKNEIYKDDICKLTFSKEQEERNDSRCFRVVIEFKNGSWGYRHLFPELVHEDDQEWKPFYDSEDNEMWCLEYLEVIGNIHDNPELLS